ncbi:CbiX/SirB N-terminal domain-containing protein [Fontivita pretiosa]|uniref:CbiX/SirB N-terminal domain-containing protein n=1 Tax=Fontivita pretiosa TaxID=2989684 RepID=UPI003D17DF9F
MNRRAQDTAADESHHRQVHNDTHMTNGIIIVDHGSRREESNRMLEEIATLFARRFEHKYRIVEPAHMELAEPSIATAYARCVQRGAQRVIICPFFLGPGKHWTEDIPRLAAQAARQHPHTTYHVTMTLGIDDLILDLLDKRVSFCIEHRFDCDVCRGTIRQGGVAPQ